MASFSSGYRFCSPKWASTALSGEGARLGGGRWNSKGRSVVYLAESRALGALEMLVHLTTPDSRAKVYSLIEIQVPESEVDTVVPQFLQSDWRASPPTRSTQAIGDTWLECGQTLALRVPSTLFPEETNLLINPAHPMASEIQISEPKLFSYDSRLVGR